MKTCESFLRVFTVTGALKATMASSVNTCTADACFSDTPQCALLHEHFCKNETFAQV